MTVSVAQALAWRHGRHFLGEPSVSVAQVVGRLGAVPAWSGDPDLSIRRRLLDPGTDALAGALARGEVLQSFAFRGAIHLMTPETAATFLTLRASGRQWERPSWQEHYSLTREDWPALRDVVRSAVADRPLLRAELIAAVAAEPRFAHLSDGLADPGGALLKAFAWQGDLCLGRSGDGQLTVQSLDTVPGWEGLLDLEDAGHRAVRGYLSGYGPATPGNLAYWLVEGLSAGRRRVDRWLEELLADGSVLTIDVDGQPMLHLAEQVDSLRSTSPSGTVTLVPGYDQWVLGPGTKDQRVVPSALRAGVTRGANLVLHGGVVAGTWTVKRRELQIVWAAAEDVPRAPLLEEAQRWSGLHDLDLRLTVMAS